MHAGFTADELTLRGVSFREPLDVNADDLRGVEITNADGYVLYFGRPAWYRQLCASRLLWRIDMRRLRYNVAMSLDGYIADSRERYDWIPDDDTVDFAGLFARVDTFILGRRTYEMVLANGELPWRPGTRVYVVSRTLPAGPHQGVEIVGDDPAALADSLRHESGDGEIWLFGGGQLFAALLAAGQVDTVEITVVPVLLGSGVPVVTVMPERTPLDLLHSHVYPSGMIALHYAVPGAAG